MQVPSKKKKKQLRALSRRKVSKETKGSKFCSHREMFHVGEWAFSGPDTEKAKSYQSSPSGRESPKEADFCLTGGTLTRCVVISLASVLTLAEVLKPPPNPLSSEQLLPQMRKSV